MHRTLSRWVLAATATAAAFLTTEGPARAQPVRGFVVDKFEPSERGSDWFTNESLDLRGNLRPAFGVIADYEYRPLATYQANGDLSHSIVRNMVALHAGAAVNLFDRLRLSLSIPLIPYVDGRSDLVGPTFYGAPTHSQASGDLRAAADIRLAGAYGDPVTLAVGGQVWFPTGNEGTYTGDGDFRVQPRVMVAGDIGIFTYAARVGYELRGRQQDIGTSSIGSELAFSAGAGVRVADRKITLGPEVFGSTVLDDAFAKRATPLEFFIGMHYAPIESLRLGVGAGTGLTRGFGAPQFRGLLGIEWMPALVTDRDGDGIPDARDACPDTKGVKSEDASRNGCPPIEAPKDRDHDGIIDKVDACPDTPGIATGDPKTNGCPGDRDRDGVLDKDDACPDDPGLATKDPKTNGCPPDTDGDGVLDRDDACPKVLGIKTSDPKTNGCPDPDRDRDGIPNDADACPDEPGEKNSDPNKNGCPKAFVKGGEIRILDQVKFRTASAEIVPGRESEDILEAVSTILKAHPEITKVRIEGHTDNRGSDVINKKLSADRAASVVKWLTAHGIDKSRLSSQGFGSERPISENTTEAGRQNNRRVELHITSEPQGTSK